MRRIAGPALGFALACLSPLAFADELAGVPGWEFSVQPGVDIEPIAESTVTKIGYGRTSVVRVMQTATGTYSTDSLASPHVEYPGILKQRKPGLMAYWDGFSWVRIEGQPANSFVSIQRFDHGSMIVTDDGSCARIGPATYC